MSPREATRRLDALDAPPLLKGEQTVLPDLIINAAEFPFVPQECRPRKIVFNHLPPRDVGELEKRGYEVIMLRTMRRESPIDCIQWLLTMLQGVTDGTVALNKMQSEALFLDMKARGLFNRNDSTINLKVQQVGEDVKSILSWGDSRHTLDNNTTITDPHQIEELARAALGIATPKSAPKKGKN